MATIISHVKGRVNNQPFECFIRHSDKLIEHMFCEAFFAVTGEVFSEKPREYHVSMSGRIMHFQFDIPKVRAVLEITAIGRDRE